MLNSVLLFLLLLFFFFFFIYIYIYIWCAKYLAVKTSKSSVATYENEKNGKKSNGACEGSYLEKLFLKLLLTFFFFLIFQNFVLKLFLKFEKKMKTKNEFRC